MFSQERKQKIPWKFSPLSFLIMTNIFVISYTILPFGISIVWCAFTSNNWGKEDFEKIEGIFHNHQTRRPAHTREGPFISLSGRHPKKLPFSNASFCLLFHCHGQVLPRFPVANRRFTIAYESESVGLHSVLCIESSRKFRKAEKFAKISHVISE